MLASNTKGHLKVYDEGCGFSAPLFLAFLISEHHYSKISGDRIGQNGEISS